MDSAGRHPTNGSRLRFMLMDIIDLRAANGVPRRAETVPEAIVPVYAGQVAFILAG